MSYEFMRPFEAMERRRLTRFSSGMQQASSRKSVFLRSFAFGIVVISLVAQLALVVSQVRGFIESKLLSLAVSICSIIVAGSTISDCFNTRDHIISKLAFAVFCICAIWYARVFLLRKEKQLEFLIVEPREMTVLVIFGFFEFFLFFIYTILYLFFPYIGRLVTSHRIKDKFWYRFKRIDESSMIADTYLNERKLSYSYNPYGPLLPRHVFKYQGCLNSVKEPEGWGSWTDDSFNGECLEGLWTGGCPTAPFQSRETGTEAIFVCVPVLFASSRKETYSQSFWYPQRDPEGMRFGIASVEASCGGGYYINLPRVIDTFESRKFQLIINDFNNKIKASLQKEPAIFESDDHSQGHLKYTLKGDTITLEPTGDLENHLLHREIKMKTNIKPSQEALIFFHGFNCSIEFATCKLGQLLALGSFPDNIIPIVFSQSAGKSLSYLVALKEIPTYSKDAADLIEHVQNLGVKRIHLFGHSLGCDLLIQTLKELATRSLLRYVNDAGHINESTCSDIERLNNRIEIKSVILMNADVNVEDFENLITSQFLRRFVVRTTVYIDRNDRALFIAKLAVRKDKLGSGYMQNNTDLSYIDIIDTTSMDHNVHSMRHSYFNLNMQIVSDLEEVIRTGRPACNRKKTLVKNSQNNTYRFLCPPSFINADKARA